MTDEELAVTAVRSVTRCLLQPSDLDDAVQDARVAVWQARLGFDGRGRFEGFALVRARWAVIDGLRRRGGRTGYGRGTQVVSDDLTWVADDAPGPEQVVAARDDYSRTAAAFGVLTPRQRDLIAAAVDGTAQVRVAERWGVTQSAASRDIGIARRRLRGAA